MKYYLIYLLFGLLLFSCKEKQNDGAISMSVQKRDSLLIEYIAKEFYNDYNPEVSYFLPRQRDFREQLKHLRKDSVSTYTRERKFKNYFLKYLEFDDLSGYPAYAIEIINTDHEFISFFSFTDEDFYRSNSVDVKTYTTESIKRDTVLSQKINLEKNINELIQRLDIQKEEDISNFIELIFMDLLSMKKVTQDTIQNDIRIYYKKSNLNDSIGKYVDNEAVRFFNQGKDNVLMLRARVGWPGYWRIWIEKSEDLYVIKSAFFSDMLYKAYFM